MIPRFSARIPLEKATAPGAKALLSMYQPVNRPDSLAAIRTEIAGRQERAGNASLPLDVICVQTQRAHAPGVPALDREAVLTYKIDGERFRIMVAVENTGRRVDLLTGDDARKAVPPKKQHLTRADFEQMEAMQARACGLPPKKPKFEPEVAPRVAIRPRLEKDVADLIAHKKAGPEKP